MVDGMTEVVTKSNYNDPNITYEEDTSSEEKINPVLALHHVASSLN